MIRLFVYALAAIALALLTILFTNLPSDPGYLLAAWGDYTFETSLLALALAVALLYLSYRLLRLLLGWINPRRWSRRDGHRSGAGPRLGGLFGAKRRGKTEEGMLALFRGNWQAAYNLLMQGSQERDGGIVNYLGAAYAADKLGQPDLWTNCLETAEQRYPQARSTAGIVRVRLLLRGGQPARALKILADLRKSTLNDATLLGLLKQAHIDSENWRDLEKLLPTLERDEAVAADELSRLRRHLFAQNLHDAALGRDASLDRGQTLDKLRRLWKKAPPEFHRDKALVARYARLVLRQGAGGDAAAVIEQALATQWEVELIELYGVLALGDDTRRLNFAEQWLEERNTDADLQLALGRLSMRNELWGKAKRYLQASIACAPSAAAHGELSRLLENLGETAAAKHHLEQYRQLAADPLAELPLPKPPQASQSSTPKP